MKPKPDPNAVPSHRMGRRMFGDYPVTGPGYWIWLGGVVAIFLVSLALMFAVKG